MAHVDLVGPGRDGPVWLAKGDTFAELRAHLGVSTDTAWQSVDEAVRLLAPPAPSLADAIAASGDQRRLLLDGTLIPAWRCASPATDANPDRCTAPSTATTA